MINTGPSKPQRNGQHIVREARDRLGRCEWFFPWLIDLLTDTFKKLRDGSQTITFILLRGHRSGFISISSIFCNHHCYLISVCFHYSKKGPTLSLRLPPFPSSWQPPIYFLSLSVCLLWTSQMPGINQYLLHLAYFTWRNISKVFPGCSTCQHFMLLYGKQIWQFESVILNNYNFESVILSICYFEHNI